MAVVRIINQASGAIIDDGLRAALPVNATECGATTVDLADRCAVMDFPASITDPLGDVCRMLDRLRPAGWRDQYAVTLDPPAS